MVILFCTNTYESTENGPSKFARFILELNKHNNITLHILTEDIKFVSHDNVHKVKIREGLFSSFAGMITRNNDYFYAINKFIKNKSKPDIIIFNNAIVGVKSFKSLNIPCIGMINDDSSVNIKIFNSAFIKRYVRHKIFNYYESLACKYATGIIVNSKKLNSCIQKEYTHALGKTHLLYKSIDTNNEVMSIAFKKIRPIHILFVKSDWQRGGLKDLIKAIELIDVKCLLHIVGPKTSLINHLLISNTNPLLIIKSYGPCSQEVVFDKMKHADIFCTPSISEALGVANMEALLVKLPVVYTDIGGIPEVMDYGKNGFYASANNPLSLSKAILECIYNEQERIKKANAGYLFVKSNFNKERMFDKFKKICTKVISA